MGIKRIVDTDFWEDDKVMLMFSPEDKLFFLYLMTNPHTTQLGIYKILTKQMAFELGYSLDTIDVLLDRFENKYGIIKYSKTTKELAIKNYLRYSIVKGGKPVLDLLEREANQVKDKRLLLFIKGSAELSDNSTVKSFCETITTKYINDNDKDNVNDNDNDNDNEDSYHESYHESFTNRKPVRHKYGEYSNVMLSDEDMDKLKTEFPTDWKNRIERLSSYIASTGKSYKNHLATIRNWARDDKNNQKPTKPESVHEKLARLAREGAFNDN